MVKGWTSLSLRNEVVAKVDAYIESNEWGFRNRTEVVTAALRQLIEDPPIARSEIERALRAVAALNPETPAALLEALLAELDMKVVHGAQGKASKSSSESTKRR